MPFAVSAYSTLRGDGKRHKKSYLSPQRRRLAQKALAIFLATLGAVAFDARLDIADALVGGRVRREQFFDVASLAAF